MPETTAPYPQTPMLDKMLEAREALGTQQIGEFLDWAQTKGYMLGEHVHPEGYHNEIFVPLMKSIQDVLAEYAEVDPDEMAKEREAVLEWVREQA